MAPVKVDKSIAFEVNSIKIKVKSIEQLQWGKTDKILAQANYKVKELPDFKPVNGSQFSTENSSC